MFEGLTFQNAAIVSFISILITWATTVTFRYVQRKDDLEDRQAERDLTRRELDVDLKKHIDLIVFRLLEEAERKMTYAVVVERDRDAKRDALTSTMRWLAEARSLLASMIHAVKDDERAEWEAKVEAFLSKSGENPETETPMQQSFQVDTDTPSDMSDRLKELRDRLG